MTQKVKRSKTGQEIKLGNQICGGDIVKIVLCHGYSWVLGERHGIKAAHLRDTAAGEFVTTRWNPNTLH